MHSSFVDLKSKLLREQQRSAEMQQKMFEMIKTVQQFVIDEAVRKTRVIGDLIKKSDSFHNRCIPEYTRKSYDLGITAYSLFVLLL